MHCSQTSVSFLDTLITVSIGGTLTSLLYWRESAGNTIFVSVHPRPSIGPYPMTSACDSAGTAPGMKILNFRLMYLNLDY